MNQVTFVRISKKIVQRVSRNRRAHTRVIKVNFLSFTSGFLYFVYCTIDVHHDVGPESIPPTLP